MNEIKNTSERNANQERKRRDFAAMDWVRDDLAGKFPDAEYGLLAWLSMKCDHKHQCFPSIRLMANTFRRNPRTIIRRLGNLESWGLISKCRRRNRSTLYTLNVGETPVCDTTVTPNVTPPSHSYVTTDTTEGEQIEGQQKEGVDEKSEPTVLMSEHEKSLDDSHEEDLVPSHEEKKKGASGGGGSALQSISPRWAAANEIIAKYVGNVIAHPNARIGLYYALGRNFYPDAPKFKEGKTLTSGQLKALNGLFETYGAATCHLIARVMVEWSKLGPKGYYAKTNPDIFSLDFDELYAQLHDEFKEAVA